MYEQIEKPKENKSRPVGHSIVQKKSKGKHSFGFVDNRPEAITQRKLQEMANNSQAVSQFRSVREMANANAFGQKAMQLKAMANHFVAQRQPLPLHKEGQEETDIMGQKASTLTQGNLQQMSIDNSQVSYPVQKQEKLPLVKQNNEIVQRIIDDYKPGKLRKSTIVMRGLTEEQRAYVQKLHNDDDGNVFSVEDARAKAIEEKPGAADDHEEDEVLEEEDTQNPYIWEVKKKAAFTSADVSIQSIVSNFGHPTQAVTAVYMDLGKRIGNAVKGKPKEPLSKELVAEVYQLLNAQIPLHFGDNPFLTPAWQGNLEAYTGQKSGKSLYGVLRSKLTGDLRGITNSVGDFDAILKAVSDRPPEVHHFLFKAIYGDEATMNLNLGLVERSPREKDYGPGQHELMHYIASGASKDKFKVLTQQFVDIYNQWVKDRYGTWLLSPIQ
ncbi:MAG: hypothetical protein KAS66_05820 [Candidatus Omnitrophica bacterium]|nr:hypothetical protein [Candidatus Omnitrophota bacterium]